MPEAIYTLCVWTCKKMNKKKEYSMKGKLTGTTTSQCMHLSVTLKGTKHKFGNNNNCEIEEFLLTISIQYQAGRWWE